MGNIYIGGEHPVTVQTMTNTVTADYKATLSQIKELEDAGADIIRVSVPDDDSLKSFSRLLKAARVPLVADIHFDYRMAIKAIEAGAPKIRINPGTIGTEKQVEEIIKAAREAGTAIRIGLNAASLPVKFRRSGLVAAADYWIKFFEDRHFTGIVVSAKSSSPLETIKAYEEIAGLFNYPLHIGVTESGTRFTGSIRSAAALGVLLYRGIGDTLRVSLAASPVYEVFAGIELLKTFGLRSGPVVIACPTCSRTRINVEELAERIERLVSKYRTRVHIAVMGCEVNGPGEAREADFGIAGTRRGAMVFRKGKAAGIFSEQEAIEHLIKFIEDFAQSQEDDDATE